MKKLLIVTVFLLYAGAVFSADDYAIDEKELLKETEKKPWSFGGFVEVKPSETILNRDAALYKLNYYDSSVKKQTSVYDGSVMLNGSLESSYLSAYAKGSIQGVHDYKGFDYEKTLYETYVSFSPSHSFRLNAGKESLKWGKGYAWNPSAFFSRPKNTDEPELDIEGYLLARADIIFSFDSILKTVSFTPLILPVRKHVNDDYTEQTSVVSAGKLYLLLYDTDLDFVYSFDKENKSRAAFSFSRNIGSAFEIHGDSSFLTHAKKVDLTDAHTPEEKDIRSFAYLAGIRFITERELTIIAEFYHNDAGKDQETMKYSFMSMNAAYDKYTATGNDTALKSLSSKNSSQKSNPMMNYLYFRASQKDPFDILYVTPAVTWLYNLDDRSFSISPEISYSGITDLDIRLKASALFGKTYSEFGEKSVKQKLEMRVRYSF
jgi:hypothetical protein